MKGVPEARESNNHCPPRWLETKGEKNLCMTETMCIEIGGFLYTWTEGGGSCVLWSPSVLKPENRDGCPSVSCVLWPLGMGPSVSFCPYGQERESPGVLWSLDPERWPLWSLSPFLFLKLGRGGLWCPSVPEARTDACGPLRHPQAESLVSLFLAREQCWGSFGL